MRFAGTLATFSGKMFWSMDFLLFRISGLSEVYGNCENPFDVGKNEDPPLSVARHFRVFAGSEMPTDCVGVDAQERAQLPGPVMVLLGDLIFGGAALEGPTSDVNPRAR